MYVKIGKVFIKGEKIVGYGLLSVNCSRRYNLGERKFKYTKPEWALQLTRLLILDIPVLLLGLSIYLYMYRYQSIHSSLVR